MKNALETLRDSVPRLRQVYGTSLPLELATTDRPDERGLIGGLEPLGKPTKKTVMLGARLYIEYLETEQRCHAVRLGRAEEQLRGRMRTDEWARWQVETENQVQRCAREYAALLEEKSKLRQQAAAGNPGETTATAVDPDGEEEDEDDVKPRKRPRVEDKKPPRQTTVKKPRTSITSTTSQASSTTSAATAAFYSFGLAYVLFPRATEWLGFRPPDVDDVQSNATTRGRGKVLLPLATTPGVLGLPPLRRSGSLASSVLDLLGFLVLGLIIMAWVYAVIRPSPPPRQGYVGGVPTDDEEPEETVGADQVAVHRLGHRLALGTVQGLASELVQRIPFMREESTTPSAGKDWYKVLSAYVGGESFSICTFW